MARTGVADVWRVTLADGTVAALKCYDRPDMGNEAAGFDYLASKEGVAAAQVLSQSQGVALSEWLDGPHLGDLARTGRDAEATQILLEVAQRLRANPTPPAAAYPRLENWFEALFDVQCSAKANAELVKNMHQSRTLARRLLDTTAQTDVLHGDLHHDNIRQGARGWCAFDAKGVVGDPAYELANAFRNPKGAADLQRDPARISHLAQVWSQGLDIERTRLLQWAAVKCALSIAWRAKGVLRDDKEADLLSLLLHHAEHV